MIAGDEDDCCPCVSSMQQRWLMRQVPYKGTAGKPFSTSLVAFLPKAGLELRLKEPLLRLVVEWAVFC